MVGAVLYAINGIYCTYVGYNYIYTVHTVCPILSVFMLIALIICSCPTPMWQYWWNIRGYLLSLLILTFQHNLFLRGAIQEREISQSCSKEIFPCKNASCTSFRPIFEGKFGRAETKSSLYGETKFQAVHYMESDLCSKNSVSGFRFII